MAVRLVCNSIEFLPLIARKILMTFKDKRIFAFEGKMGAGKTTLIREICRCLGVVDPTSSPSFGIVNEYVAESGTRIYHFDFYRVKDLREVYDMGYEEYFFSGAMVFIEWPEKIKELLPEECVYIRIEDPETEGSRSFVFDPDQ